MITIVYIDDTKPKEFVVHVAATKQAILQQEDTNRDYQVTIEDTGPKTIRLGTLSSGGFIKYSIHGTYMISSLLQELALASNSDEEKSTANYMVINEAILQENPVERLHRMIINQFWPSLIRRLDVKGLLLACADTKNRGNNQQPRIYIPHDDGLAKEYYQAIARDRPDIELDVVVLPEILEPKAIDMLRYNPGILSLALNMSINPDTTCSIVAAPFVVPGGRFNELYGWDSYFCATGLLADWGKAHSFLRLSKSMVENLIYEINHYGKILNANRSYYLTRSQPPFLTSMILKVYDKLAILRDSLEKNYHEAGQDIFNGQDVRLWLEKSVLAAIKEYKNVWMQEPRLIPRFGLSRYYDEGRGIPTETEATHYKTVLEEYSKKYNVTMEEFIDGYNSGKITEPTLDEYILHDRALRESGHDTTYRFEGRAANLLTVDLNSLLYKYEIDIAKILKEHFGGHLESDQGIEDSSIWFERAEMRKQTMYQLMWDPVKGLWFDYDFIKGEKSTYESATTFWTLWAGLTNPDDAKTMRY